MAKRVMNDYGCFAVCVVCLTIIIVVAIITGGLPAILKFVQQK